MDIKFDIKLPSEQKITRCIVIGMCLDENAAEGLPGIPVFQIYDQKIACKIADSYQTFIHVATRQPTVCGVAWNTRRPGCTVAAVLLFYGHF